MRYRPNRNSGISSMWVIIIVTVIVFIAEFINPVRIFDEFGLTVGLIGKHPWTLFTYMFVHGGFARDVFGNIISSLDYSTSFYHIFFNMITLYFFGTFALQIVGELAFLTTYFIGGIAAGLSVVALSSFTGHSGVVGASGAIFALGGLLMVMRPNVKVITFPIPIPMPLWIAILVGFLLVMFLGGSGIAWEAHLGGLVYGAAVGLYFRRREIRRY